MKTQKGNKALKNKSVSYRSQGRTAHNVNTDIVSGNIVRTGHKIGKLVHHEKYKELYKKQALANALIKESRQRLGSQHTSVKSITAMKKQFYGSRGLKSGGQLSFKNLTKYDIDEYNILLDAIINEHEEDRYLNPEKYEEFRNKMDTIFKEQWKDKLNNNVTVDDIINVLEDDITTDLSRMGINYRDVFDTFSNYPNATSDDIVVVMVMFKQDFKSSDVSTDDFLRYADDYLSMINSGYDMSTDFMRGVFRWYNKSDINDINEFNNFYNAYMNSDYIDLDEFYQHYLDTMKG